MLRKHKSLGMLLAAILLFAIVPSNAFQPYASKLKAPTITSITAPEYDQIVVKYKKDKLRAKKIRHIKYSIDGRTWLKTLKSPITITGLEAETTYTFRLRQTSIDYRVTTVTRSITTPAQPDSESTPELAGFTVGNLMWADEFNSGNTINSDNWTPRYCGHSGANGGGTCHNNESQYYIPEAITIENGNAVITTTRINSAPPAPATCLGASCAFTSGRFDTQDKVSFQYGYIEARMKMPQGEGNWPAFWMLGADIAEVSWPNSGEMDIAEQGGHQPWRNSAALHYSTNNFGCCGNHLYEYGETIKSYNFYEDFHTFGLAWTPDQMTLYVDRVAFWTVTKQSIRSEFWPGNKPYFLILNNAIGPVGGGFGGLWGDWTTSKTYIDYVRVYKVDGHGTVND